MDRKAKGLRVAGGISILLNIIIFFLPVAKYELVNYPTERFSQWDYVMKVFSEEAPYEAVPDTGRYLWLFFFVLLPFLLSLVAGVWGMVGSERQIVSSILIIVVAGIYIVMFLSISSFFPEHYNRDIGGICNLAGSGIASVFAVLSLIFRDLKEDELILAEIPQVQEIKQEQIMAKYSGIVSDQTMLRSFDETAAASESAGVQNDQQVQISEEPEISPYVPGVPRGVMLGLTGIYKGAEIAFGDGESIKIGRSTDNDLIFEDQEKVSRYHCCIKWDGAQQKFFIKDTSSNGTFVNESEDCLPQNIEIELPLGSVIAIGDESNTFRLE